MPIRQAPPRFGQPVGAHPVPFPSQQRQPRYLPQPRMQQPQRRPQPVYLPTRTPTPQHRGQNVWMAQPPTPGRAVAAQGMIPPPPGLLPSAPAPRQPIYRGQSQPTAPRPIYRGQDHAQPQRTRTRTNVALSLPAPSTLGIATNKPTTVPVAAVAPALDWNNVRSRLRNVGALSFHTAQLAGGQHRVAIAVPGSRANRGRLVEVIADSEAAAVRTALQRAEQYAQ